MRAPKTDAEPFLAWCRRVNNTPCNFALQWPNWTGIFDTEGEQRDVHGQIISQEAGLSTPFAEYAPSPPQQLPPTEKRLSLKNIGDALSDTSERDYFNISLLAPSMPATPLGDVSNVSERGSEVPTETALSVTTTEIAAVDGVDGSDSSDSDSSSSASPSILNSNGAISDSSPEISPTDSKYNSSFGSDGPSYGHKVRKSLSDNYWVTRPS